MSFRNYKQTIVSDEIEAILDEPLINMLLSICFNHAKRRHYEVSDVQLFELYQFEDVGMHILGLIHISNVSYTKVEMGDSHIMLPEDLIIIEVRDNGLYISVERGV